jgi:Chitobiase/beta-hexosaminidase C-terminal domain
VNMVPVIGNVGNTLTLGPFTADASVVCFATLNGVESAAVTAAYVLGPTPQAAAPTITPDGGPYQGTLAVSLTSTTAGAIFNCTTDGSTPTTSSPTATGFTLTGSPATETISCIASANEFATSPVTTATFTSELFLGNPVENSPGSTSENLFNAILAITGSNPGGYTVSSCTLNQGTGAVTNGANTDCLVVLATSPTTMASTPLCKATYTNTSAVGANPTIPLSGCGTLAPNTLYWVLSITNDPLSPSSYGFSDCPPSGCIGGPPTAGENSGTYPGFTAAGTYGVYTALPATLQEGVDQPSQFITLAAIGAQTATPVIAPPSGTFEGSQTVTITDSTSGSSIFFCLTAGCTPTPSSTQYTGPFSVSTTTTVTAIATSSGASQSAQASATYTEVVAGTVNLLGSGSMHSSGNLVAH